MKKVFALIIFILLFQSLSVWAETLSIGCPALLPVNHNVEYDCNGGRLVTANSQRQDFVAPVFLPTGSLINKITVELADTSGGEFGGYVQVEFLRAKFNTLSVLKSFKTSGPDAPGDIRIEEILDTPIAIDNSEYSYHLTVWLLNGAGGAYSTWFFKTIIEYEPPSVQGTQKVVVIPLFD